MVEGLDCLLLVEEGGQVGDSRIESAVCSLEEFEAVLVEALRIHSGPNCSEADILKIREEEEELSWKFESFAEEERKR